MGKTTNTSAPTVAGEAAVVLDGVSKHFGDVVAVDAIDLSIGEGEFFALLGPSGCGKTTTLRMIAGLESPTSGRISVHGADVAELPANRRPVNTVFQDYALFPHLDLAANVGFGLRMRKVPKAEIRSRVAEALELVKMSSFERRRPSQISGGQRQRVALARALVNRPKVLLLDEPLGALDLQLRREMQHELKALQRELGIAFVFVTHDQEEALSMSDRIAIMLDGRLLQVDTPAGIYERPVNRFVAGFIGQTNLLEATVADERTICLTNGTRLAAANALTPGSPVGVILRPERARLERASAPESVTAIGVRGDVSVAGTVDDVTYLGNAVVHRITLDWIQLDVRVENRPDAERFGVGDEVRATWPGDAVTLVET